MADPDVLESETPAPHDPYAAWRNPLYRRYLAGFFVAVIGGQMQTTGRVGAMVGETKSA